MFSQKRNPVFLVIVLQFLAVAALGQADKMVLNNSDQPVRLMLISESPVGCKIQFQLNELNNTPVSHNGQNYSQLEIAGGGMSGQDGDPGLPIFSGMIAVPEGHTVSAEVLSFESRKMVNLQVAPLQPDGSDQFAYNSDAYRGGNKNKEFRVQVGDPAILHGQSVAPFVVHPVNFDPEQKTVSIATEMELEFTFNVDSKGQHSRREFRTLPESFANVFDETIINSRPANKSHGSQGPGTYLVIHHAGATATLQPLLDWRRRQGYNVLAASTGETGSSQQDIKNYIQNIYDSVEPPLEYVVLAGDASGSLMVPTWIESVSGYYGEGDHYYTTLDGDDVLSDVHLGRLSAQDPTELSAIITKILTYEMTPFQEDDPDWYNRASLTGDPGESGITTIYVSQWLKAQLENLAFTHIDTIYSGNFRNLMMSTTNQGISVFSYRGIGGMSGLHSGHIMAMTNGHKLPFAVLLTCDTGSFLDYNNCRSEAFLRNPNGGAVGAIGMATNGTHTRYNNSVFHGIWEGALNTDNHHLGAALSRGKLEMYRNYQISEPFNVETWCVWVNLMGDPATRLWLDKPANLDAEFPSELPAGASSVPVTVSLDGQPAEGVLVALYKRDEVRATATTDASGFVNIPLSGASDGTLLLTATKHNCKPLQTSLTLGQVDVHPALSETVFDDADSNDDGHINPGETVSLQCALTNQGINLAGSISAELISRDPLVSVIASQDNYGDIAAGQTIWSTQGFEIMVSNDAADQQNFVLDLVATNGTQSWTSAVEFTVRSAEFRVDETSWYGPESEPAPGQYGDLVLAIQNTGSLDSGLAQAVLSTEDPWILVIEDTAQLSSLSPGDLTDNSTDHFSIQIDNRCYQGHLATFNLAITLPSGSVRKSTFLIPMGTAVSTDPVGPDAHGYYAYDNTDTEYEMAPVYDWVEINPALGGPGSDTGLTDDFFEQDQTEVFDLPFEFQYYGAAFEEISICTNGWIAMGSTSLRHYRNFTIPSAGSPNALIAPYWDNLYTSLDKGVYHWYDEANARYIVEWSQVTSHSPSYQTQEFQAIFFDPAVHQTSNGDGLIMFQYKTVNNVDLVNGYATVGIQNLSGTDGVLYTYWNEYAPSAAPLQSGRAILFAPTMEIAATTCEVSPALFTLTMAADQVQTESLSIANNGEPGSELYYVIQKVDPYAPVPLQADKNMSGSTMSCLQATYSPGETASLQFQVDVVSPDNEYMAEVSLDFPLGATVLSSTNLVHSGVQTLNFNGATGEGATVTYSSGFITSGNTATCTIDLDFSGSAGALILPYSLTGDNFGGAPHTIEGNITILPTGASISLLSPSGGETWPVGEEAEINFLAGGGMSVLNLEIDRGLGDGWQLIQSGIPVEDTQTTWLVEEPISANCRLRLSDPNDPSVFDINEGFFTIGRNLGWVILGQESGTVLQGQHDEVELQFDTTGLKIGTYAMDLLVRQTANGLVTIPVRLTVTDGLSGNAALPMVTRLHQNHPNPFNPQTEIGFSLKESSEVQMDVYNARGQRVCSLIDGVMPAGNHSAVWLGRNDSGRQLSSGVYYYRLVTNAGLEVRKMTLVK